MGIVQIRHPEQGTHVAASGGSRSASMVSLSSQYMS
jgi:hypothetical protein